MAGSLETPELHVEGRDDRFTIAELLQRHGIDMSEGKRPFKIIEAEGVELLLEKIPIAIEAATTRPVGFVLDIDVPIAKRWTQVLGRLHEAKVDAPKSCPADGFVGRRKGYPNSVGVWLMPDCQKDSGKLEFLLETLIPKDDTLWPHAQSSTDEAKKLGAEFRDVDHIKACVYCWLAWQEAPGLPFGKAIKAKFFSHDSPQAQGFVQWVKKLYGLA